MIAREDSGAVFDLNGDGFATWTAWLGSGSGFLAHDVSGNGRIDDISELFGVAAFNGPDDHGFTMLALHDFNGDSISGDGELLSLAATGIVSISLNAAFVDDWRGANWISHTASYTLSDGTVREIHDVWFDNDPMHSYYAYGQDLVLHEDVAGLPDLAGYGFVKDLRFAMSEDEDLREMMRDLVLDAPSLGAALDEWMAWPLRGPLARQSTIRLIRSRLMTASLNEPVTGRRSFTVDKIDPGGAGAWPAWAKMSSALALGTSTVGIML